MPSTNFCGRTNAATNMRNIRGQKTDEQIPTDNTNFRVSMAQLRKSQSQEARAKPNEQ